MKFHHLGRTGLEVSRLCLGTMNFGPKTTEKDSHSIMDAAVDAGINFFDTANVYGWKSGEGWTEQIIGRWLAQGEGRRDRIILATKVYGAMGKEKNKSGLSAYHIRQACEESLKRLKTDRIDLYQMHHVELTTPWEEIWQAMEQLVREGKILYVGSSNFAGWQIATANQIASRRNFLGLVSEQSIYSLMDRTIELEVIPACRDYGVGLLPWSPLGRGLLAGSVSPGGKGRRASEENLKTYEKHRSQFDQYESLCKEISQPTAEVAIAWLLSNPVVTSPVIGPRTMEQLKGNLRALDVHLDKEVLKRLDAIWPGPGGEAPAAYAW